MILILILVLIFNPIDYFVIMYSVRFLLTDVSITTFSLQYYLQPLGRGNIQEALLIGRLEVTLVHHAPT